LLLQHGFSFALAQDKLFALAQDKLFALAQDKLFALAQDELFGSTSGQALKGLSSTFLRLSSATGRSKPFAMLGSFYYVIISSPPSLQFLSTRNYI
jgi:hypothetical protein